MSREKLHIPRPADAENETDYSELPANDFDPRGHDRMTVRSLQASDFEEIRRLDRRLAGHDRADYLQRKMDEALHQSGVRVSVTARLEDSLAGYLMARIDFGDYGHTEPIAVLDTIGVDPGFAGRHVGEALISQLMMNLHALQVERIETTLSLDNLDLMGFLHRQGFAPSQRLALRKRID